MLAKYRYINYYDNHDHRYIKKKSTIIKRQPIFLDNYNKYI